MRFLFILGLIFPLSPILVSLITGGYLEDTWGISTGFLAIPFLLAWLKLDQETPASLHIGARRIGIVFLFLSLTVPLIEPFFAAPRASSVQYWTVLQTELSQEELANIRLASGAPVQGWGATWYLPTKPHYVAGFDLATQPWTTRHMTVGDLVLSEGRPEQLSPGPFQLELIRAITLQVKGGQYKWRQTQDQTGDWSLWRITAIQNL